MLLLLTVSLILCLFSISRSDGKKKCHQNIVTSSSSPDFSWKSRPRCYVPFLKMRGWSVKLRYFKDTILSFIDIIRRIYTIRYDIQIFTSFILYYSTRIKNLYKLFFKIVSKISPMSTIVNTCH